MQTDDLLDEIEWRLMQKITNDALEWGSKRWFDELRESRKRVKKYREFLKHKTLKGIRVEYEEDEDAIS